MRVTILSNSMGGVFGVTMQWAKGLVSKGCEVNIFFLMQSKEAKSLTPSKNIHFHYFITSNFLPSLQALVTFLIRDHPDVIHINFASLGPLAIFKKVVFKIPYIYTSHGLPQPWLERSLIYKIAYAFEASWLCFTALRSFAVVAVSNYVRKRLMREYRISSKVIYHGISIHDLQPRKNLHIRKKLGYNTTDFIALFVGRMHPSKNPLILLKAIPMVLEKYPNFYLAMIGEGELYEEIKGEIIRLNITKGVKLFREIRHEDLRMWYNVADILVFPSVTEAFGIILLEAMASGLPVIAADAGACREIIDDAGILFHKNDHVDLAEKILNLVDDNKLRKKLSEAGLKRIREVFLWEDKIEEYLNLYVASRQNTYLFSKNLGSDEATR